MANVSQEIEQFILSVLGNNDEITISRNELAQYFAVAPSQINYVLSTRFSLGRGYIIRSKRGGGGSITVIRISTDGNDLISALLQDLSRSQGLSYNMACDMTDRLLGSKALTQRESDIIRAAVSDKSLDCKDSAAVRRNIYKEILISLMRR